MKEIRGESPRINVVAFGARGFDTFDSAPFVALAKQRRDDGGGVLYFPPGRFKFASNTTLDGIVELADGAVLVPDSGVTLTFTAPSDLEDRQYFDASLGGGISFAGAQRKEVRAVWFGSESDPANVAAALTAATTAGIILYTPGSVTFPVLTGEVGVTNMTHAWGTVERHGGAIGGVTDNGTALANAITSAIARGGADIALGPGTYYVNQNINAVVPTGTIPRGVAIRGVPGSTFLKFGPAVTAAVTLGSLYGVAPLDNFSRLRLSGVTLDGSLTTGARGLIVGDNPGHLSGYITLEDVEVLNFQGAGAYGLVIKDIVGLLGERIYVGRCQTNLLSDPTDLALPTMVVLGKTQIREAIGRGVEINSCYNFRIREGVIEACGGEALYCVPGAGKNCQGIELDDVWLEGNCITSGTHVIYADGTGSTVEIALRGKTRFGGSARGSKALYYKAVANSVISDIVPRNLAGDIEIDDNSIVTFSHWPEGEAPFDTVVSISSLATVGALEAGALTRLKWSGGHLVPRGTDATDLGSAASRFRNGMFGGNVGFQNGQVNVPAAGHVDVTGLSDNALYLLVFEIGGQGDLCDGLYLVSRISGVASVTPVKAPAAPTLSVAANGGGIRFTNTDTSLAAGHYGLIRVSDRS